MSTRYQPQERYAPAPVDRPTYLIGLRPAATAAAYLGPPAIAVVSACFVMVSGTGPSETTTARLVLVGSLVLAGLTAGALAGCAASVAERRAVTRESEQRLDDLDHDLRTPMTIIRGEVELVLSQENVGVAERGRSIDTIIEQLERMERRLQRRDRS
jgi:signal transduction histidine kinase